MSYTPFQEGRHVGEHLVSEAPGRMSREAVIVEAGADLVPGTILGRVTANGKYAALTPGATDGTETAAAILWGRAHAASADVHAVAHTWATVATASEVTWPAAISGADKTQALADLAARKIFLR